MVSSCFIYTFSISARSYKRNFDLKKNYKIFKIIIAKTLLAATPAILLKINKMLTRHRLREIENKTFCHTIPVRFEHRFWVCFFITTELLMAGIIMVKLLTLLASMTSTGAGRGNWRPISQFSCRLCRSVR